MHTKTTLIIIVLLFFISIGGVLTIRAANNYPLIMSNASYKTLSLNTPMFYINFLNLLENKFGGFSVILLQLLETLIIFISFYFILKKLKLNSVVKIVTFIFLCVNPILVWSTLVINTSLFVFMMFSLIILLFLYKKGLGLLFSLLLLPINIFYFVLILTFFSVYKNKKVIYIILSGILIILLFLSKPISLHNFIFEFGVLNGYSFAFLLIAFIGLFSFPKGTNNLGRYILLLILLAKELLFGYEILLTIPLLIFSVGAIESLRYHKWSNKLLRLVCVILLFFTLLFPFTTSLQKIAISHPNGDEYHSLMELRKMPNGKVLALTGEGFIINHLANKSVVKNETIIKLFSERSISKARDLLKKLNVNYLWVTPKMKKEYKEGIVFLLRDNQTFQMKNEYNDYEIWKVLV